MTAAGVASHLHYWLAGALLLIGLYGMLAAPHLIRKLIGLNILLTAVIAFFITLSAKTGSVPPIVHPGDPASADRFGNPLPHALMLTAIVVGVATTGVALALIIRIYRGYGTLDERELLKLLRQ